MREQLRLRPSVPSRSRAVLVASLLVHLFVFAFAFSAQLVPRTSAPMVVASASRVHSITSRSSITRLVEASRRHAERRSGTGPLPLAAPVHVDTGVPRFARIDELAVRFFDEPVRSRAPAVNVARGPPHDLGALASAL